MDDLILHATTRKQLDAYLQMPAQVLILAAPDGSGKQTIAKRLAENILQLSKNDFDRQSQTLLITAEDGKAIGIESARQIERFLRLKVPGTKAYNRAVIISDSHTMTPEAQNALLKTLEEPPTGTIIILTTSYEPALLPTVRSRAQIIVVEQSDQNSLGEFFKQQNYDDQEIKRAYNLSDGQIGLMHALLSDKEHPLHQATEQARQLLSQPVYERLIIIDTLSKDKQLAMDTTTILQRMARVSLNSASDKTAKKWQSVLEASYQASEALSKSGQPKLVLAKLVLQF